MVAILRGDQERARHMLLGVLAIVDETRSKPAGQSLLEVCAGLCSLAQDWTDAARFYGAAEAQARHTGIQRDAADEAFLKPLLAKARDALGAPAFSAAEAAGRALPYEDAIAAVRAWLTPGARA
jgi:hypothetical protein